MTLIYNERYQSSLGQFHIEINTDRNCKNINFAEKEDLRDLFSESYFIRIAKFYLDTHLYNGAQIKARVAWCFFFQKIRPLREKMSIRFELRPTQLLAQGPDSGQFLDSMSYTNPEYQIHLGTEDGEKFKQRSNENDWLPRRYAKFLDYELPPKKINIGSFTQYTKNGFITILPRLRKAEQAYFHFVLAENINHDDGNIDTNLAVDVSKEWLLENRTHIVPTAHST